jgi:hypothetical protein
VESDKSGNVIETHEHPGDLKGVVSSVWLRAVRAYQSKHCAGNLNVFVKCRSSNALDNSMKTNPIAQDSGWNFSFWFAVSSPLLGVLLAMVALAIFCR